MGKRVLPILFIEMDEDLGVGKGGKLMSSLDKVLPEFTVVVDLTVEDDTDRFVFVEDRLITPCDIDDREPPHPQGDMPVVINPFIVRAAVKNGPAHHRQKGRIRPARNSDDSAHNFLFSESKRRKK